MLCTIRDPNNLPTSALGEIVLANEEAQDTEWKQLQRDAALGRAVRAVVTDETVESLRDVAKWLYWGTRTGKNSEEPLNLMLAIVDVLEAEDGQL
jgi:hypothetical protein